MPESHPTWQREGFTLTTDPARIDREAVYAFLSTSYWAKGLPRATFERSLAGSLCFSILEGERQVGFARVITDMATIAYLGDVFVLEPWRGRGLSRWLMECITSDSRLQDLRRWILLTRDAHGLYAKFGFTPIAAPDRWMNRWDPDVYQRLATREPETSA